MEDFLGKEYSVFADNFCNTMKLAKHLSKQKTYICGTLCGDRKGNPKDIVKKKLKKGESVLKRSDDVVVCQWKNKHDVLTISNKHSVELVPVPSKRGQLTTKPNIVCDYNNGRSVRGQIVSGVDRSDQMLSHYQGLRKCI